jgi:hypothetical protein
MKVFKMAWARWFKVISNEQAKEWGLTFYRNVYGDEVNRLNCRSIWTDNKGRRYYVALLHGINYINVLATKTKGGENE